MKKLFTLSVGLFISSSAVLAQPAINWQKNFHGSNAALKSEFNAVAATSDGGYIAVGTGKGTGGDLPSGGYVDNGDALIIKTASDGTVQWSDYWGFQEQDEAMAVIQTADGGYAVAGYTAYAGGASLGGNDGFVVKYDATGTVQWEHIYGGSGHDIIYDIKATTDGGYIFVGTTKSPEIPGYHDGNDLWAMKIDATGTEVWSRAKGGAGSEVGYSVALAATGGYIVTGSTKSPDATNYKGGLDMWVLKLTTAGAIAWQTCVGGTNDDYGSSVITAADGSIWVTGGTKSNDIDISGNHGGNDLMLAHLNTSGSILSTKVYGGSDEDANLLYKPHLRQTTDGGFVMLSSSKSNNADVSGNHGSYDFWLLKTNASGNLEWQQCIGSTNQDYANALDLTSDGGYILAGQYNNNDAFLVRMKGSNVGIKDLSEFHTSVYPNPANDVLHITTDKAIASANIFDMAGRKVWSSSNISNKTIRLTTLNAGIYFLQVHFQDGQSGGIKIHKQ